MVNPAARWALHASFLAAITAQSVSAQQLEEVLVTAQKREESAREVPIAVSTVSGDMLTAMAVVEASDIPQFVPGLNFEAADETRLFNFSIRGIGTTAFSVGVEPSVSTVIDGVVYTRAGAVFDSLGDIQQIEVLGGPQGTLFGKNASAGAVNIRTRRPNQQEFEGKAELTVAEQNEHRFGLTLTGPLNDALSARLFTYYRENDGIVKNLFDGSTQDNVEAKGARGKLLWEFDSGDLLLTLDYSEKQSDCCGLPIRVNSSGNVAGNVTGAFTGTPTGPENTLARFDVANIDQMETYGASLEGNWDVGSHTLTSITAWRYWENTTDRDRDGTQANFSGLRASDLFPSSPDPVASLRAITVNSLDFMTNDRNGLIGTNPSLESSKTFSEELRIASPTGGPIDYVAGLFYYFTDITRKLTIAGYRANNANSGLGGTPLIYNADGTIANPDPTRWRFADMYTSPELTNYAAFGQANWHVAEQWTVLAGLRALKEEGEWFHHKVNGPNGDHFDGAATGPFTLKYDDEALIGKAGVQFKPNDDLMLYVTYSTGYKGRAVDADIFTTPAGIARLPTDPETSRSYEAGLKGLFFDQRVAFNLAVYDTLFDGFQTTSSGTDGSGNPVLQSAGEVQTRGVEWDFIANVTDSFSINGAASFTDNEFASDLFITPTVNVKGGELLLSPKEKWNVGARYEFPIGGFTGALFSVYSHTGRSLFTNLADANNDNSPWWRPAYGIANFSASLTSPGDRYVFTVFVKNAFDEHYVSGLRRISGSVGGGGAIVQTIPRDYNRYFGGTFTYSF